MAEKQLKAQIASLQAELANLRVQMRSGPPTAPKDLSLMALISMWTGTAESIPVSEFFEAIDGSARVGRWTATDKIEKAVLKLTAAATEFHSVCLESHAPYISWTDFKRHFQSRFRDVHNDQYNFIQLQTTKRKKRRNPIGILQIGAVHWHAKRYSK
jgi:hypothetical protein